MKARNYEFENMRYEDLERNVTLPEFQRSLVWSNGQKNEFIATVKEGNPFGCILVYKNMERYEIIDGLQRFTTLRDYKNNPAKYLAISSEIHPEIKEIAAEIKRCIPSLNEERLEKTVIESIKETLRKFSLSYNKLAREIRKSIISHYGEESIPPKTSDLIEDQIYSMIDKWESEIDFKALKIPTIIYTGNGSELPDIFEKLNTGGTKLSKYEVFASTWNTIELRIEDEELLNYVEESYKKKCERTNLAIANYEEGSIKTGKVISLYELCFAFGKKIKDSCPILFATYSDTDEDQVDSIGFTSLATVLGISLKKLATVNNFVN